MLGALSKDPSPASQPSAARHPLPQGERVTECAARAVLDLAAHATSFPAMYAPHVLPAARDYAAMFRSFRWQVPARYNIGVDACDRWAEREPRRTAILNVRADGGVDEVSYGALRETSNRLANVLAAHGIGAATGSRSCCRNRRRSPPPISRSTSSAPSRCRSRCCSASRRSATGSRIPARGR